MFNQADTCFVHLHPQLRIRRGITELVGAAGAGKTQTCLSLAVMTLAQSSCSVIYIDTESTFSATRLVQIATNRFPALYQTRESLQSLSEQVITYKETSGGRLYDRLQNLQTVIIEKNVKMVIVDSMASPMRQEFDTSQAVDRQELLSNIASVLKIMGEKFSIPIVVTNQVTPKLKSSGVEAQLTAALGVTWAHSVCTRLILEPQQHAVSKSSVITIAKSPCDPESSFNYQITPAGFEVLEEKSST